ncbi:hypothetical protein Tco_0012072 [Tanacetum coccineum]
MNTVRKIEEYILEGSSLKCMGVPVFDQLRSRMENLLHIFVGSLYKKQLGTGDWILDTPTIQRPMVQSCENHSDVKICLLPVTRLLEKLNPGRYIGPFKIIAKVGTVAYRLELPEKLSRVHSTFHVSKLKKCMADEPLAIPLDEIQVDDKLNFIEEPVEIMDREVKRLKQSRYSDCQSAVELQEV